ncbi:hypothetical protein [Cellulomonas aerilata]|uniref:Uncharacterized protein n=1 Tax=Cellulomonas aerilata TaxID=515326 RepID=A0A512DEV7_9CELL|nr:hypothetical protein [Cellulomonas aerilata]GEO35019.1 hypothetical protein CAE01nite_27440 [Cellulomonas aerilata]
MPGTAAAGDVVDLAGMAAELYACPPGDFTATRNARAKQVRADGDRDLATQVQALRKPSVAAWAVNALVRRRPAEVEELLALGAQLRDAQAALDGRRLRELDRRQHELMAGLRRNAETLASEVAQSLTDAVAVQVEGTLRAAMTDPDAEAAVRSGLLTGELLSTGFGPVEVGDALAVPGAPPVLVPGRVAPTPAPSPAAVPPPSRPAPPPRRSRVTVADEPAASRTAGERTAARGKKEAVREAESGRRAESGRGAESGRQAEAARRAEAAREAETRAEAARQAKEARAEAARQARREAAVQDVALAEGAAAEADGALRAAEDAVADLARRHAELTAELERLTARLHEVEAQRTTTGRDQRHAQAAREAAARAAESARRRARTARRQLDDLD